MSVIWGMKEAFMIVLGVLVLLAIALTAISNANKQNQNNSSDNKRVDGYIYHDSKNVLFLKFTNKDGVLNGSYYCRWEDQNN